MILTLYALFGSDIKIITCDKTADTSFDVVSFITLALFSFELGIIILIQKKST